MQFTKLKNSSANVVLIVDDAPDSLSILHDALDESGFTVLVANHGEAAVERAIRAKPDIILLDAVMPGIDGFEVCRRLKDFIDTRHIPVIFMTGLTESEHVVAAFEAGGIDYVTKPIRPREVIARITTHLQSAQLMHQARVALDAFGQAIIAITPINGRIVWQTPLARQWLDTYFTAESEYSGAHTPVRVLEWLNVITKNEQTNKPHFPLTVVQGAKKLIFSPIDVSDPDQWMISMREESDVAQIDALMHSFKLTQRESEVLYWIIQGKTTRDIGEILGSSPRTVNKHIEHVFIKLGVETRTAAATLATSKLRAFAKSTFVKTPSAN